MAIPENDSQLWKGFNGHGLYSKRAERDVDGNVIDQTYAKKAEVPDLDNALSTSATTAITPKAVKDAIAEVDVIPTLPQNPSSLYSETSGSMAWGGWDTEDMNVPVVGDVIGDRVYDVVKIGNQTWLAENLDYKFAGLTVGEGSSSTWPRANYYQDDETAYGVNGNKYGLLYNWVAAKYLDEHKDELIPGWHVPTLAEWNALATAVGGAESAGMKLKTANGWSSGNGNDSYGFSVQPAGYQWSGFFDSVGNAAYFWTATENSPSYSYYVYFNTGSSMSSNNFDNSYGASIRLIKDA